MKSKQSEPQIWWQDEDESQSDSGQAQSGQCTFSDSRITHILLIIQFAVFDSLSISTKRFLLKYGVEFKELRSVQSGVA